MNQVLGLVLTFTNQATGGINSAVNSLTQLTNVAENASNSLNQIASLSAFSSIANSMGSGMLGLGTSIISTYTQAINKVRETGQTLMFAERQLGKLYEGSGKTGKDVIAEISDYAKKSIFDFENLIPVVTMLKANGIEAFEEIYSSSGKTHQKLMDYAADLAAFNPQMHNAYGTGIRAAMGALNEYIAEGNARSLKSGASLDITAILGEDKGKSIEERSRQVADLLEKLNMVNMTAKLADTPMTKLSNMGDVLFQFLGKISDSGVYEAFNRLIDIFANFVFTITDSQLDKYAKIIGDALSSVLKPVEFLAKKVVDLASAFLKLIDANPELAKMVTVAGAFGGALLIVGGIILKVLGSIGYLALMISTLGTSFGAIGGVMKAGVAKILGSLVPLTLAIGVLYFVWKNDLFGIRTMVTEFAGGVVNAFSTARLAVGGSLSDMQGVLATFDTSHSFFDGLTLGIMRVQVLAKALAEGWNDFELSEDTYLKAKELGILPLIEAIFDLKYRFDLFKEGFLQGWQNISDGVRTFVDNIKQNLNGTIFDDMLNAVTSFFQLLSSGDEGAWQKVGEYVSYIIAGFIALKAVITLVGVAFTVVSGVIATFCNLALFVYNSVNTVIGIFKTAIAVVKGLWVVISTNPIASAFGGFVSIVMGAYFAVSSFIDMFMNGFSLAKEALMLFGIALTAVGAVLLGAPALVAAIVAGIVALIANAVILIKSHWESIKASFFALKDSVVSKAIEIKTGIIQRFTELKEQAKSKIDNLKESVISSISNMVSKVTSKVDEIKSRFTTAIENAKSTVSNGIAKIKGMFNFSWSLPKIKLPHFSVSGGQAPWGFMGQGSLPKVSVSWYKRGGIFDKPSIIGVGEQGREAVVPLENNTEWIGSLAMMLTRNIGEYLSDVKSVMSYNNSGSTQIPANQYMTTNNENKVVHEGNTDNSIVIQKGAITLIVQNASDEEAERLAVKILEYIKRQRELENMLAYN